MQPTSHQFGILTFQWKKVDGTAFKLWNSLTPSKMGTAYNHGTEMDYTPGWEKNAPMIEVRRPDGGYTTRWYADDMWDDEICGALGVDGVPGWGDEFGALDTATTLSLGQGAWVSYFLNNEGTLEPCSYTVAGEVASEEVAVGGDTSSAYLLCGGAFPVAFQINDTDKVTWTLTPGTAFNHGTEMDYTPGWEKNAPMIEVRRDDGGYTTRYYADDMWDDELCAKLGVDGVPGWGDEFGALDLTTTVGVGGGFWLTQPNGDKKVFVTVNNPIAK